MKILCCLCGTSIEPNDAAMCVECLRQQFCEEVSKYIDRSNEMIQCSKCGRWHIRYDNWLHYDLESSGLLSACLRKIPGLHNGKCKLLDAAWVWTEPHSKRLKISIDFEAGVLDDKVRLRQKTVVEFVVRNKQCMECIREATDHTWGALVQVRQRVGHKQSLYMLEHLLTKAKLHELMLDVKITREGLDMYFRTKGHADKVAEFVASHMPSKLKISKKLVSRDLQSNTCRYEVTIILEIAPICKGDLVITPKEVTGSAELMVVTKVAASAHLVSPITGQKLVLNANKLFSTQPLVTLLATKHLVPFVMLDVTPMDSDRSRLKNIESSQQQQKGRENGKPQHSHTPQEQQVNSSLLTKAKTKDRRGKKGEKEKEKGGKKAGDRSGADVSAAFPDGTESGREATSMLAEAEVARESDLGENDTVYRVSTHLGHIIQPGDTVLGYDMVRAVVDEDAVAKLPIDVPDVVLVRKVYPDKEKKNKKNRNRARRRPDARRDRGDGEVDGEGALVTTDLDKESAAFISVDDQLVEEFSDGQVIDSTAPGSRGSRSTVREAFVCTGTDVRSKAGGKLSAIGEEELAEGGNNGKETGAFKHGRLFVSDGDGHDERDDEEYEAFVEAIEDEEEDYEDMIDEDDYDDIDMGDVGDWEEVETDDLIPVEDDDEEEEEKEYAH